MKKLSFKVKIALALLLLFLVVTVGGTYYVSTKISPQEVRKVVLESLQKSFPEATIELSELDYSLGFSFGLNLHSLSMKLKNGKGELLNLNNASVRIPIWAILMEGGTISLEIDSPSLFYTVFDEKNNNWSVAMGPKKEEQPPSKPEESAGMEQAKKVKIINFFANSQIDIKLTNLQLHYLLKEGMKGNVTLSRFLIKKLNLKTPTAFEVDSKIDLTLAKKQKLSLEALIIGQVNIHEMVLGQDIKSSVLVKLENIHHSLFPARLPSIKTDLNVTMKQPSGEIQLTQYTELENVGHIGNELLIQKDSMVVDKIDMSLFLKELIQLGAPNLKTIQADKAQLVVKGQFKMIGAVKVPQLDFILEPGLTVLAHPQLTMSLTAKGSYHKNDLYLQSHSSVLSGSVDTTVATQFDLNRPELSISNRPLTTVTIKAKDIQLSEQILHETIYGTEEQKLQKEKEKKELLKAQKDIKKGANPPSPAPSLPPVKVIADWGSIGIGKEQFSGHSVLQVAGSQVASKETSFQFSEGQGALTFLTNLLANSGNSTSWDFTLNKLNLSSLKPFLPPQLDMVTGTFTGKVKGNIHMTPPSPMTYNVDYSLDVQKGELKGIKIGPMVEGMVSKIPFLKDKAKDQKIDNNFESLQLVGNAKHNRYVIERFLFWGVNKQIELKGNGTVYPPAENQVGSFDLDLIDHTGKLSSLLEKNTGSPILPMRLQGKGFSLMPDYQYTLERLAKGVVKKNEEKVVGKVKETAKKIIDKEIDKIGGGDKNSEKIKSFLNGILK